MMGMGELYAWIALTAAAVPCLIFYTWVCLAVPDPEVEKQEEGDAA